MGLLVIQIVYSKEDTIMNDENIQKPDENFSLGLNIKYNFMNYGSQDIMLFSKSPVFVGLSFLYTMNRIQKSSSGSFIAGGNIRLSSIKPYDKDYIKL